MPITNLHRVETVITGSAGAPYYSRQYFDSITGTPQQHVTAVYNFWNAIKGVIADNLTISVQPEVATVSGTTGEIIQLDSVAPPAGVVGTSSSAQLPYANQAMLRLNTGVYIGGRQLRGRIFIPGLTVTANADGLITAAYANVVQTAGGGLAANGLAVLSERYQQWQPVATMVVPGKVAVLRTRRD